MKEQFITLRFWIEMAGAVVVFLAFWVAARQYNKSGEKVMQIDYFRTPTSNVLVILGLLVPIMVALASYLYVNNPEARYSSLLATIVVMFIVLIVAIWETFSLLGKAESDNTIKLQLPKDRRYITGLGVMFGLLILGLFYFALFFLFELPRKGVDTERATFGPAVYPLMKPNARIGETRDQILSIWGQPSDEEPASHTLIYESDRSEIRLTFDESQTLTKIEDRRR